MPTHDGHFRLSMYKCLTDGLERIGNYAFYGCTALENIRMPATLTEIGRYAFRGDAALKSVTLGAVLERVGLNAFYGCHALTVYAEAAAPGESWDGLWNSSFRPVFWGCTLREGAVSEVPGAGSSENGEALNGVFAPFRPGYVFGGWSRNGGEAIPAEELFAAGEGPFAAVWVRDTTNTED